jgi:hypothetical protein
LHLWHPHADRAGLPDNERRLADVIGSERVRAERGMSSLDLDAACDTTGGSNPGRCDRTAPSILRA